MILNSLLDSLHHIVFINIGETKMLFLGVSEGVIHNKTDVQGEPTHPSMKAVQIIKKKKKNKRPLLISAGSLRRVIAQHPTRCSKPPAPRGHPGPNSHGAAARGGGAGDTGRMGTLEVGKGGLYWGH